MKRTRQNASNKKTIWTSRCVSALKRVGGELKRPLVAERPLTSRKSLIFAWVVWMAMIGVVLYSLKTSVDGVDWQWLAAVIIFVTGFVNVLRVRPAWWVELILAALAPTAMFMLVENYTHLLSEMRSGPILPNLVLYYLFFIVLIFVTGRTGTAVIVEAVLLAFVGLANYFVLLFRSVPILPWDLYSIGIAATVADNFEYTLSMKVCIILLLFVLICMLGKKMNLKIRKIKIRLVGMVLSLFLLFGFVGYVQTDAAIAYFNMDTTLFTPTVLYRNNGLVLSFVVNMRYLNIDKPDGYSTEKLGAIKEELAEITGSGESDVASSTADTLPNIIVIMNEAFSDLSVLGDFETNVAVTPFIDSLTENTQKGWLYASVKGGNTANTEFEFLTGLSMYFLPSGSVAYQQYIRSDLPSLASQLSNLGYQTVAIHPFNSKGWNRNTVYDYLGFDEMYFVTSFSGAERVRNYISDAATFDKIISLYENKSADEQLFVFDVTMQNHGSYVKSYDNFESDVSIIGGKGTYLAAAEQYLSLLKVTDEAFEDLVTYFSNVSEPTIILMFGDHQPADYLTNVVDTGKVLSDWGNDTTGSDRKERYAVPYILWANYDIEESEGEETSANYLALRVLEAAGIELTDFQIYLQALEEEVPVLSANYVHIATEDGESSLLEDYAYLQYNDLFDVKNRLANFFETECVQ